MAAVGVIDDICATPLLLLCSLWRLSTSPNATTATMKGMRALSARQTSTLLAEKARQRRVLEHCKQLDANRPPRTREHDISSFELTFACPTPAYQTPPERAQKLQTNKLDPTDDAEGIQTYPVEWWIGNRPFRSFQSNCIRIGLRSRD